VHAGCGLCKAELRREEKEAAAAAAAAASARGGRREGAREHEETPGQRGEEEEEEERAPCRGGPEWKLQPRSPRRKERRRQERGARPAVLLATDLWRLKLELPEPG
ncbi:Hypothetical predicted protein, partial [Podarcis lilfordi]